VRQKKRHVLAVEEKEMQLFICGPYAIASDHAVFPIAVKKKRKVAEYVSATLRC